jgi:hypothetical protein
MTTLPPLPEPEIIGVAGFCDDGIGYTEAQMLAFQAATVEACAALCESRQTPGTGSVAILQGTSDAIRAMLKEKTE